MTFSLLLLDLPIPTEIVDKLVRNHARYVRSLAIKIKINDTISYLDFLICLPKKKQGFTPSHDRISFYLYDKKK